MVKAKVQKTIAILLAMCVAFALMSVVMTTQSFAEENDGATFTVEEPSDYKGAPDLTVTITFPKGDGAVAEEDVPKNVKVYSDKDLKNEVNVGTLTLKNLTVSKDKVTFVVPLSTAQNLKEGTTYYLGLLAPVSKTAEKDGEDVSYAFEVKSTTTTSTTTTTTTTTTTRTTTRTIRTVSTTRRTLSTRTVSTTSNRAKPANTGDESNMPLWIAVAVLAAGATGIAYVWKEN